MDDQDSLLPRFTPAVSAVTEASESATIRTDSMNPMGHFATTRPRPRPIWKPYYSLASSRQQKLDEALEKYGHVRANVLTPAHSERDLASPTPASNLVHSTSIGFLTTEFVPRSHPYYGILPIDRKKWFNSLPAYKSNSTLATFLSSRAALDVEDSQPFSNAVWDGDQIVSSTDTDTPIPPLEDLDLGPPAIDRPPTLDDKPRKTICAGVKETWGRIGARAKQSTEGAPTRPTKFKMKAWFWKRRRSELDIEMMQPREVQRMRVKMVVSDDKFGGEIMETVGQEDGKCGEERQNSIRSHRAHFDQDQESEGCEDGDGDLRCPAQQSLTRLPIPFGEVEDIKERHDQGGVPGKTPFPTTSLARTNGNTHLTLQTGCAAPIPDNPLPTLSPHRRASTSDELLGPARLSDTIRRAPDSIRSTPTPSSPTSSQSQSRESLEAIPPPHRRLNERLRDITLDDILDPEAAREVRKVLQDVDNDQKATGLAVHVECGETLPETRARVQQFLHTVDENALRLLQAQNRHDRERGLVEMLTHDQRSEPRKTPRPRRLPATTLPLNHCVRHHESLEGLSPYSGVLAYAPVTESRLRRVEFTVSEAGVGDVMSGAQDDAACIIDPRADPCNGTQGIAAYDSEEHPLKNATSPSASPSGTPNTSPLHSEHEAAPQADHHVYVEDASSESDREELWRATKRETTRGNESRLRGKT